MTKTTLSFPARCPFCGRRDAYVQDSYGPAVRGNQEGHFFAVICNRCKCEGPRKNGEFEARVAWAWRPRRRHDRG